MWACTIDIIHCIYNESLVYLVHSDIIMRLKLNINDDDDDGKWITRNLFVSMDTNSRFTFSDLF